MGAGFEIPLGVARWTLRCLTRSQRLSDLFVRLEDLVKIDLFVVHQCNACRELSVRQFAEVSLLFGQYMLTKCPTRSEL